MKLVYFKEHNGDYGCIDADSYRDGIYEGRAAVIEHDISSVATASISNKFLRDEAKTVAKRDVPTTWLEALI